jgi:hypothetical protein
MTIPDHPHVLDLEPGEVVRVRSAAEIFDTLDEKGMLDNMPFMPEMVQYCGQTLSVFKRADKTCGHSSQGLRRMQNAVHLSNAHLGGAAHGNIRCNGSAHGGCQASCLVYWKEAWLERVVSPNGGPPSHPLPEREAPIPDAVIAATKADDRSEPGDRPWQCQATQIPHASARLHGWEFDQYAADVRNWGVLKVLRVMFVEALNRVQRLCRRSLPPSLLVRGGEPYPFIAGALEKGLTPSAKLDLQPGDRVRIRSREEIVKTLDHTSHNRGLSFDAEMVQYCGRTAVVRDRVGRLIDELTGQMIEIKSDCIILEGVTCKADYHRLCTRGIYPYWREIWLEKIG